MKLPGNHRDYANSEGKRKVLKRKGRKGAGIGWGKEFGKENSLQLRVITPLPFSLVFRRSITSFVLSEVGSRTLFTPKSEQGDK